MTHTTRPLVTIAALLATLGSAGFATAAVPPEFPSKESAAASAIQNAYVAHDGKLYRQLLVREYAQYPRWSRAELAAAFGAYTSVVKAHGAVGLDPLFVSVNAALGARGASGHALAASQLAALRSAYGQGETSIPPQRIAGVIRPGEPIVHFVPLGLIHGALADELAHGATDLDHAMADIGCSADQLSSIAATYGKAYADRLKTLCATPATDSGGDDLGLTTGISDVDCMLDHQPTRAERVGALMQSCAASLDGGGTDPLASGSGSVFDMVFPPRQTFSTQKITDANTGNTLVSTDYDLNDEPIVSTTYDGANRPWEQTYYNDAGEVAFTSIISYDGNSNDITNITLLDANGTPTWSVSYGSDADGNVTVSITAYDENGQAVMPSGGSDESDPGFDDGYGSTKECRQLTLALIEDRVGDDLSQAGFRPQRGTVDPTPDSPTEKAGSASCDVVAGVNEVDNSFGCWDKVASCDLYSVADGSCACQAIHGSVPDNVECGLVLDCVEGAAPTSSPSGVCSCGTGEDFSDQTYGYGGPVPPVTPYSLIVSPKLARLSGVQASRSGAVVLDGQPAGPGGATVALTSSSPTALSVPASITIAAGATSASFPMSFPQPRNGSATVTATCGRVVLETTVTLTCPAAPPKPCASGSVWDIDLCKCVRTTCKPGTCS